MMISGVRFCGTLKSHRGIAMSNPEVNKPETQRNTVLLIVSGLAPALPIPRNYEIFVSFQDFVAVATVLSICSEYSIIVSGHDY